MIGQQGSGLILVIVIAHANGTSVAVPVTEKEKKHLLQQMVQGSWAPGLSTVPGPPKGKKRVGILFYSPGCIYSYLISFSEDRR